MSVFALLLGLVAFIAVLRVLEAQKVATGVLNTTQHALSVMMNSDVTDEEKEMQVRRASLKLLGGFFGIAAIGAAAIGASVLIVWGGAVFDFYAVDQAISVALGWPFILGSTAAAVALWIGLDRLNKVPQDDARREEVPYSPMDKALHDFAFASSDRQIRLGRLENRLYRRSIAAERAERPVFITSLPRAGTTIMLEGLSALPDFASATYRHMPFTLSPLLWGGFSKSFRKAGDLAERAHGDGISVGIDSPEAFEEMLWMAFWPEHYASDHITPWDGRASDEGFENFFRQHMAKIVATKPQAVRYISKNNANIARLDLIQRIFPDAATVLPVRNPRAQVKSLLRQHERFTDLHRREPFARRYMEGIGHFEFGGALRPIRFDGAPGEMAGAKHADFWLRYWIAAYEHVLKTAGPNAIFVDHDALCEDPQGILPDLGHALQLQDGTDMASFANMLRAPRPVPHLEGASADLLHKADELHIRLCNRAIGTSHPPFKEISI